MQSKSTVTKIIKVVEPGIIPICKRPKNTKKDKGLVLTVFLIAQIWVVTKYALCPQ